MPLASPRTGFRRSAAALLAVGAVACADEAAAAPDALSDTTEATDSGAPPDAWDTTPPTEAGTIVTFGTECALLDGVLDMSWELVDPATHDWMRAGDRSDETGLAEWLPMECYPQLEHPAHLYWGESGEIEWSVIHRVSPTGQEGTWLGVIALDEAELSAECVSLLAEHGASVPAIRLSLLTTEAP